MLKTTKRRGMPQAPQLLYCDEEVTFGGAAVGSTPFSLAPVFFKGRSWTGGSRDAGFSDAFPRIHVYAVPFYYRPIP